MHVAYCNEEKCIQGFAGFEVLTAVTMTGTISWDVTLCKLVEVYHVLEEHTASIFRVEG
jgi:hypothetical protein